MPALMDILKDVPFIDFDTCISWQGACLSYPSQIRVNNVVFTDWALPDQLVFSTVSALLRLSSAHPQYAEQTTSAIAFFLAQTVEKIEGDTCMFVSIRFIRNELTPFSLTRYPHSSSACNPWLISGYYIHIIPMDYCPMAATYDISGRSMFCRCR